MSRKIKFRAWDELRKIMYSSKCVDLLLYFDGTLQSVDEYGNILGTINTPEMLIMQYTGFKDNKRTEEYPKGQEIYDGDILAKDGCWKARVEFKDGTCWIKDLNRVRYNNEITCVPISLFGIETWEVIGNICENPNFED